MNAALRAIILLTFSIFSLHANAQYKWEHPLPHGNALQAVSFYDTNHGFFLGRQFSERLDTATWTITQECDSNLTLNYVGAAVQDSVHGWAIDGLGKMFRLDSLKWKYYTDAHDILTDISMPDATHGCIVGDTGLIVMFDGVSWTQQPSPTSKKIWGTHMLNDSTAWAVGDNGMVLRYKSGVWSSVSTGLTISAPLYDVFATDTMHLWIIEGNGSLLQFVNGTWSTTSGPWGSYPLRKIQFTDATHGWAIAGTNSVYFNDGTTWSIQYTDTNAYNGDFQALDMLSNTDGWIVGAGGNKSHWNGTAWINQTQTAGSEKLNDIYAADSTHIYACGTQALYVLKSNGYENQWPSQTPMNWTDLDFYNQHFGIAVHSGSSATVAFCRDSTWKVTNTGLTGSGYNAVDVVDSMHIWAVGVGGIIDRYDGFFWSRQTSGTTVTLNSVSFVDSTLGFACGNGGTVRKYHHGVWTAIPPPSTEPLVGLYFTDSLHGWVFSKPTPTTINAYRYRNGSWVQFIFPGITCVGNKVNIQYISPTDEWACIGGTNMYFRFDGTLWYPVYPNKVQSTFYSGYRVSAEQGWICGEGGNILKIDNFSSIVGIDEHGLGNGLSTKKDQLVTVYPNPSVYSTTLQYVRSTAGKTALQILDVNGRILLNLVDKYEDSGKHEVIFETSRFANGIYLYRFNDGSKVEGGSIVVAHE
jgi:hypothetical protein